MHGTIKPGQKFMNGTIICSREEPTVACLMVLLSKCLLNIYVYVHRLVAALNLTEKLLLAASFS